MMNIEICRKLFNVNPIETSPDDCEAAFIGSILNGFLMRYVMKFTQRYRDNRKKPPVKIWGSGFIKKRKYKLPEIFFRRSEVHAVRGFISRDRLQCILKTDLTNIPVGDPGLLASRLIETRSDKKWAVGIIPHCNELDLPIWKNMVSSIPHSTIIRVDDTVENTIRTISECDTILSSSLHGLIAADSFNIPNARLVASSRLCGGDYKFNDYYSVFGIAEHRKIDASVRIDKDIVQSITSTYTITEEAVDSVCSKLISSFPYTE